MALPAWPNSVTIWWFFFFGKLSVAVVDKFGWCVFSQCRCLWFLSFGINKLEKIQLHDYVLCELLLSFTGVKLQHLFY